MKFKKDIEFSPAEHEPDIEQYELKEGLALPSDYRYLLLNFNEVRLANDAMAIILDDKGEEISGVDGGLYSLRVFQHAFDPYPSIELIDEDLAKRVSDEFFSIATLFYQGILLIGKTKENENQIYGFVPDYQDSLFFLAENISQFFNDRIIVVE